MYSLDTSALLDGGRRYYPPDVFPPLWEKLSELIQGGKLSSPDEVREELKKKDDEVWRWAREQIGLFVPLADDIQSATVAILAAFPKLVDTRRGRGQADPFVIAHARVNGHVVVTGERRPGTKTKPTIPYVCRHFNVRYLDLLGLMREQGWTFSSA
jgi:hypothetical protein